MSNLKKFSKKKSKILESLLLGMVLTKCTFISSQCNAGLSKILVPPPLTNLLYNFYETIYGTGHQTVKKYFYIHNFIIFLLFGTRFCKLYVN